MTDINSLYPAGEFMKKEDVPASGSQFVIASVSVEEIGGEDRKPVVKFQDGRKFVLNKTNAGRISFALGTSEVEQWAGKTITLYNDPTVEYGGKMVGGIRVATPAPTVPAAPLDDAVPF